MLYEIFTFGGGDYVAEIFNAIVRVMGANSFNTALKISVLFGFFTVFFDIAINGNFTKGVKYYLSFFLIYNLLFVPKVDIIITDLINPVQTDRKVDNVPFGLAFAGHTISSFGNWITNIFGMNFVLPNDLQYNKSGILFGSTLIQNTFNTKILDSRISNNFNNYIKQCIIPAINLKRVNINDVIKSNNIQNFLQNGSNGVLAYNYINKDNVNQINLCNDVNELNNDIGLELNKLIDSQIGNLNKNNTISISNINQYMLGIQNSTTNLFEQSLIANAISNSTQDYLATVGANTGAVNYAITKDDIQRKQNSIIQWLQAGKFLPLLKIIIETMFYGLFPIVVILMMLPQGIKIFKNYLLILLALQVWSPLYAILNLIMTLEQKYRLNLLISETYNQISLYNKQAILDIVRSIQTQAGIFAFAIPPLSFKIVQGMNSIGDSVLSNISSSSSYSTGQIVNEISSGSLSYGNGNFKNISYDNLSAHKKDDNEVISTGIKSIQNGDGITYTKYSDGLETLNVSKRNTSYSGINFKSSEGQVNSSRIALQKAQNATEQKAITFSKSIQDLQNFSFADTKSNGVIHNFSESDAITGGIGIGGGKFIHAQLDYKKAVSWLDQQNISTEDRKSIMEQISKFNQHQQAYNTAHSEQLSKQKDLNYVLNTGINSDFDANNEVERHFRQDLGWDNNKIKEIITNNPRLYEKMGREWLSEKIFNKNIPDMLGDVNSAIDIAKNNYNNQNNIMDIQYEYHKNYRNNNSIKQFQNTNY